MSTETIQVIGIIACIAAAIFLMRWMTRYFIRKALAEEGFETSAVFTEIGETKTLTATDKHGTTLVARVSKQPTSLTVRIKTAVIPVAWDTYHWMELSDGTRLQAQSV